MDEAIDVVSRTCAVYQIHTILAEALKSGLWLILKR